MSHVIELPSTIRRAAGRAAAAFDPLGPWAAGYRRREAGDTGRRGVGRSFRHADEAAVERAYLVSVHRRGVSEFRETIRVEAPSRRDAAALAEALAERERGGLFEATHVIRAPRGRAA